MVEYENKGERAEALRQFANLSSHLFLVVGEERLPSRFLLQPGEEEDRLPAVNYVRIAVPEPARALIKDPETAVQFMVNHPHYEASVDVSDSVRRQFDSDLSED